VAFRNVVFKELPPPEKVRAKPSVRLFNGKDLTGWFVDGGSPKAWRVERGAIVGRSPHYSNRNYLLSDKEYADFVLRFDYKVEEGSHGAVAVRAVAGEKLPFGNGHVFDHPLIKLTNPAMEEKEPTGTTFWLKSAATYVRPVEVPSLATDTWHSMEVVVKGGHCTATVNGDRVVNLTLDPDPRNSGAIVPGLGRRKGRVGFQINTGTVRYRNVEIQELPRPEKVGAKPSGHLFNGKDLTGWEGLPGYWHVQDGAIVGRRPPGKPAHTFLVSERTFKDFDLKFQVRRKDGVGSTGLQFRSRIEDRETFTVVGPQCAITAANAVFPPGSLLTEPNANPLAVKAPRARIAQEYKEAGFNDFHVRCVGKHVTIKVNGVTAVDGDYPEVPDEGVLAWQFNGWTTPREVTFRNVEIKELPRPEKVGEVRRLGGHTESVWGVAFAPGGRLAATGGGHSVGADGRAAPGGKPGSDFDIRLWDTAEGREIGRFEGHTGGVGRLAFSPDGKRLASAGGGGERTIRLWDVATRQQLACLKGHEDVVTGIAFTPDGHRLLSAGWGSRLRLWDTKSGEELKQLGPRRDWHDVTFSPDGRRIAACGRDFVALYDPKSGEEIRRFPLSRQRYCHVVFSADGRRLASAGLNDGDETSRSVRVWDVDSGRVVRTFRGGWGLAFLTEDGSRLLAGGIDFSLRLWDVDNDKELRRFPGHSSTILSLALAPDGRHVLTGGADNTARLWRLPDPARPAPPARMK
jgi:WD40 repeat protein